MNYKRRGLSLLTVLLLILSLFGCSKSTDEAQDKNDTSMSTSSQEKDDTDSELDYPDTSTSTSSQEKDNTDSELDYPTSTNSDLEDNESNMNTVSERTALSVSADEKIGTLVSFGYYYKEGEDIILEASLALNDDYVYVDLYAFDYITFSKTYYFQGIVTDIIDHRVIIATDDNGDGIAMEPDPDVDYGLFVTGLAGNQDLDSDSFWGNYYAETVFGDYGDYDDYDDYDDYGDWSVNETGNSTQISESEIKNINYVEVTSVMTKWKNDYNKNKSNDAQIGNISAKTLLPKIEYGSSSAVVTTQVEYWFKNKGGSASGSVYVIVTIDLNSGKVISSSIQY